MPAVTTEEVKTKIDHLIRARYPIIGISSHEEDRVCGILYELVARQGKKLVMWSQTMGFFELNKELGSVMEDGKTDNRPYLILDGDADDPFAALQAIPSREDGLDNKQVSRAVYVIKDLHPWISPGEGRSPEASVVRALRDLARSLTNSRKTVILLSPMLSLPVDLQKEVQLLDFPLPDKQELLAIVEDSVKNAKVPVVVGDDTVERLAQSLAGLTYIQAKCVLRHTMVANMELSEAGIPIILEQKRQALKSSTLEYISPVPMEDVGGLDLLREYVRENENLFNPDAAEYGVSTPKGFIMVGVPGGGKSLVAKTVGGGLKEILRMDMAASMGNGLLGEAENAVRNNLKTASAMGAGTILWIDEVEKALGSQGGEVDGGTMQRIMQYVLTWMQEQDGVYVIATCNSLNGLRPEMLRRFDDVIFVDVPSPAEAQQIVAIHLRKSKQDSTRFNLAKIASALPDYTGAEIEKAVRAGMRRSYNDGKRPLRDEDIIFEGKKIVPLARSDAQMIANLRLEMLGTPDHPGRARPASSHQRIAASEPRQAPIGGEFNPLSMDDSDIELN